MRLSGERLLQLRIKTLYSMDIMDKRVLRLEAPVTRVNRALALFFAVLVSAGAAAAQSLNWEGQTGVFITPLAYTAASPGNGFGHPIVAYHFLNAGSVLGNFHTVSVTEGLAGRVEFGYTRDIHQQGSSADFSPLWDTGFNLVHAKVNFVKEMPERTPGCPHSPRVLWCARRIAMSAGC